MLNNLIYENIESSSLLFSDEWLEFNEIKWKVRALRKHISINNGTYIKCVFYIKNNRIVLPKTNPYLPIEFCAIENGKSIKVIKDWLKINELLIEEIKNYEIDKQISFSPNIYDMRVWQWNGYIVQPQYTFILDLPIDLSKVNTIRTDINKCKRNNYKVTQTNRFEDVYECLKETEKRKYFLHGFSLQDLHLAYKIIGEKFLRFYVCYDSNNNPVSACVILIGQDGRAIYWMGGTKKEFLKHGVAQYTMHGVLQDLQKNNVSSIDLCGANIKSVAAAKSNWGGRLIPYYSVSDFSFKNLILHKIKKQQYLKKILSKLYVKRFF